MILGKKVGGGEYLSSCPSCGREKFYRNPSKQKAYCQRCGFSQNPSTFGTVHISDQEVAQLRTWPRLIPSWDHPEARAYLMGRGVKEEHPDILYDPRGRRLYFRIWSPSPEFQPSYHTRGIDEGTGWVVFPGTQKAHYVWGTLGVSADRMCLVEGIFDAVALGEGAVALLGTQMSATQQSLTKGRAVGIWLDNDMKSEQETGHNPGREASGVLYRRLGSSKRFPPVQEILDDHEPSECVCPTLGKVKEWLRR